MRVLLATLLLLALPESGLAASPATSDGGIAVLGFGDCANPVLANATRAVRTRVDGALSEQATAAPGGGLAAMSVEEVRRTLEMGKTAFLNLDPKAESTLRDLLPQIDHLPLGTARWELFWETRAWLARVLQHGGQKAKATELYLQILRVDEDFQLSKVDFPPSSRDLLDLTRQLSPSFPRARLTVAARGGKGQVYLNGFAVGPAPFSKALIAGDYEVVIADGTRRSFVRRVKLAADTTVEVDLEREAPFAPAAGPCYQTGASREERLKAAATLAGALGTSRVVAVRLERLGTEEYVAAALVEVAKGRETREGRVRHETAKLPSLGRLAQFVLTGEGSPDPVPESVEAKESAPAEAVAPAASTRPMSTSSSESLKWQRPVAYALWGLALAAGGVAVYEQVHAGDVEKEISTHLRPDGSLISSDDEAPYNQLKAELNTTKALRTGMAVGAGVAAAAGVGLFVWSVVPSQDGRGASLMVAGNF
ncbi:MAG: PEGA domain-containing protein [Myxococcales bacterium]